MKCEKCGNVTHKKIRSNSQNSYYWDVVIGTLSDFTGYPPPNMHDALKVHFLSRPDEKTGLMKIVSTTDLTTKTMEQYIEQIRVWAAQELGVNIPKPNETHEDI